MFPSLAESPAATRISGSEAFCLPICLLPASPEAEQAQLWIYSAVLKLCRQTPWMAALISMGHQFLMEKVNDSSPFQLTEAGWARALDLVEVCGVLEGRVRLD